MVMRTSGLALLLAALIAWPAPADASARTRYERAVTREKTLRLDGPRPSPLSQVRRAIALYEEVVRQHPTSGYADNALWQGALLALAAHRVYSTEMDRERAIEFLQRLLREYPSSSLRDRARALLRSKSVSKSAPPASPPVQRASARTTTEDGVERDTVPARTRDAASAPAAAAPLVALRAVRREVVHGIVRITLELDGEASYSHEMLSSPARLYVDLNRVQAAPALEDAVLSFDGTAATQIRLGRPRPDTTRLVIALGNIEKWSVFALYSPYRLTIDLEPPQPSTRLARAAAAPPPTPLPLPSATTPPVVSPLGRSALPATSTRTPAPALPPSPVPVRTEPKRPKPIPHPSPDRPSYSPVRPIPASIVPPIAPPSPPPIAARPFPAALVLAVRAPASRPTASEVLVLQARTLPRRSIAAPGVTPPKPRKVPPPPEPILEDPVPLAPNPNDSGGFSLARQLGLGVSRIVIDPGHGGRDPGATGPRRVTEAAVVLDVALRLEKLLKSEPGFEVSLTRRTDIFVPLEERTAIANREHADLFLSIHANSSRNTQATGVETYYLNFALNPEAEAVAARENAGASQTMSHLPEIVRAIAMNNKLDESRDFAQLVQEGLVSRLKPQNRHLRDLGVKQAPFVVLIGAGMPSVLAEIAFLSNTAEGSLLRTGAYRQQIAEALRDAVKKYQRSLKAVGTVASQR
jgi:N-acetylmuramoyl-L-alanine amidase